MTDQIVTLTDYAPRFDALDKAVAALAKPGVTPVPTPTPTPVPTPTPTPTAVTILPAVVLQDFTGASFGQVVNGVARWQAQNWMKDAVTGIGFSPKAATMANGEMDLKLDHAAKTAAEVQYNNYYSSVGGFRFGFEVTLDVPQPGVVQSPLFLYGNGGELDFELTPKGMQCTLHGVGTPNLKSILLPMPTTGKHTYEIFVAPQKLAVWFIDGVEVWRVASTDLANPTLFPTGPMTAICDVWASSNAGWVGAYAQADALMKVHRWGVQKSA